MGDRKFVQMLNEAGVEDTPPLFYDRRLSLIVGLAPNISHCWLPYTRQQSACLMGSPTCKLIRPFILEPQMSQTDIRLMQPSGYDDSLAYRER